MLRDDKSDKDNDNESSFFHQACGKVVHSQTFQHIILFFIICNSLLTAISTFDFVYGNADVARGFEVIDTVLLCIFTGELILHLYFYKPDQFFSDGWLTFDFAIVTLSWAFQAVSVLRAFRILRAIRIVTHIKEMRDLVQALLSVMPRMFAIFSLLLLIYFVFAVLFTELFKSAYQDGVTSEDCFSRLDVTAFTMLQFMFLDDWSAVTKELMEAYPWAWIPILSFIVICTFIVVNLIIAVICDAVQAIQTDEMSSQIERMQRLTSATIRQTEENNKRDTQRLETKIDQLLQQLSKQKSGVQ